MNDFELIAAAADKAIASGYVAGVTVDGLTVYHVLTWQGTIMQYWFTLNPDVVDFATKGSGGDIHRDHFDIRECTDKAISDAVVHWSKHRSAVVS